jgi:hypothetical protein
MGEYAGRSHMSIESEKEETCRMIFCARPTFIIDLGVVHQSFDHVVSIFKEKKETEKKKQLSMLRVAIVCCLVWDICVMIIDRREFLSLHFNHCL